MLTGKGLQNAYHLASRRITYARVSPQALREDRYLLSSVRRIRTRRTGAVREEAGTTASESSAAAGAKDSVEVTTASRDTIGLDNLVASCKTVSIDGHRYRTAQFGLIRLDNDNSAAGEWSRSADSSEGAADYLKPEDGALPSVDVRNAFDLDPRPADFFGIETYLEQSSAGKKNGAESLASGNAKRGDRLPIAADPAGAVTVGGKKTIQDYARSDNSSSFIDAQYFPEVISASPARSLPYSEANSLGSQPASFVQPEDEEPCRAGTAASLIDEQYFGTELQPGVPRHFDGSFTAQRTAPGASDTPAEFVSTFSRSVTSSTDEDSYPIDSQYFSATSDASSYNTPKGRHDKAEVQLPAITKRAGNNSSFTESGARAVAAGSAGHQRQDEQRTGHGDYGDGNCTSRKGVFEQLINENSGPTRDSLPQREGSASSCAWRPRHQSAAASNQQSNWQGSQRDSEDAHSGAQRRRSDDSFKRDVAPRRGQRGVWHESEDGDRLRNAGESANGGSPKNRSTLTITPRRSSSQAPSDRTGQWPSRHDSDRGEAYSRHAGKPWMRQNTSQFSKGWEDDAGGELGASLSQRVMRGGAESPVVEEAVDDVPRRSITDRLRSLALANVTELEQNSSRPQMDPGNGRDESSATNISRASMSARDFGTQSRPPRAETRSAGRIRVEPRAQTDVTRKRLPFHDDNDGSDMTTAGQGLDDEGILLDDSPEQAQLTNVGIQRIKAQVKDLQYETVDAVIHSLKSSVIHQCDDLLAINKPYGLSSHGGPKVHHSVAAYLPQLASELDHPGDLHLVHRLDRDTTGVLLLAKTQIASVALQRMFQQHQIVKKYWALTRGVPEPKEGIIEIPIAETQCDGQYRMMLKPNSTVHLNAVTKYRVLSHHGSCALVEAEPVTGVKHQIRVHLSFALDATILGDHKYSNRDKIVPQRLFPDLLHLLGITQPKARYLPMHLHARSVVVPEFSNGRNVFITAKLPKHFVQNMRLLKVSRPPTPEDTDR